MILVSLLLYIRSSYDIQAYGICWGHFRSHSCTVYLSKIFIIENEGVVVQYNITSFQNKFRLEFRNLWVFFCPIFYGRKAKIYIYIYIYIYTHTHVCTFASIYLLVCTYKSQFVTYGNFISILYFLDCLYNHIYKQLSPLKFHWNKNFFHAWLVGRVLTQWCAD